MGIRGLYWALGIGGVQGRLRGAARDHVISLDQ